MFGLQADNFQRQGKQLRRKMWFQNFKVKLIVLAIIIVVILIIYLSICHGFICHSGRSNGTWNLPCVGNSTCSILPAWEAIWHFQVLKLSKIPPFFLASLKVPFSSSHFHFLFAEFHFQLLYRTWIWGFSQCLVLFRWRIMFLKEGT